MFNLKQASRLAATIAAISVSAVCSTTAQAAIVGGRVSGTWQSAIGGVDGLNVGTDFTTDYTYDDSSLVTTDVASSLYTQYLVTSAPLLSLIVNSGALSQTFNLSGFGNSFSLLPQPVSPSTTTTIPMTALLSLLQPMHSLMGLIRLRLPFPHQHCSPA